MLIDLVLHGNNVKIPVQGKNSTKIEEIQVFRQKAQSHG